MDEGLDAAARQALGKRILQACRRQRVSLKALAYRAKYDQKTIRNVIRGEKTRTETLENVCRAIGIELGGGESRPAQSAVTASDAYGGYSKAHYSGYLGLYVAYRHSFTFPKNFIRTFFQLSWRDEKRCLVFHEQHNYYSVELKRMVDYSQSGDIYINNLHNLLHLVTSFEGAIRLITLTRMQMNDDSLRGVVLTQAQGEFYSQPSVSPIILQKVNSDVTLDRVMNQIGPVYPDDANYDGIALLLGHVQRKVANFAVAPDRGSGQESESAEPEHSVVRLRTSSPRP